MIKAIEYDSFGNVISDSNESLEIPFGFAGGLQDADTQLLRFGYRDYDPQIGRWTARDPIGFAGGDTNLYGYVFSAPLDFIDPDGLMAKVGPRTMVSPVGGGLGGPKGGVASCPKGGSKKASGSGDKKLSNGEIKKLKEKGLDPHDLKPKKNGSKYDLFKDKDGNIIIKPKKGNGPGDPTGININEI